MLKKETNKTKLTKYTIYIKHVEDVLLVFVSRRKTFYINVIILWIFWKWWISELWIIKMHENKLRQQK